MIRVFSFFLLFKLFSLACSITWKWQILWHSLWYITRNCLFLRHEKHGNFNFVGIYFQLFEAFFWLDFAFFYSIYFLKFIHNFCVFHEKLFHSLILARGFLLVVITGLNRFVVIFCFLKCTGTWYFAMGIKFSSQYSWVMLPHKNTLVQNNSDFTQWPQKKMVRSYNCLISANTLLCDGVLHPFNSYLNAFVTFDIKHALFIGVLYLTYYATLE